MRTGIAARLDRGDDVTVTPLDGTPIRIKVARIDGDAHGVRSLETGRAELCVRVVGYDAKGIPYHMEVPAMSEVTWHGSC